MPDSAPIDLAALAGGLLQDLRTLAARSGAEEAEDPTAPLEGVARLRSLVGEVDQARSEAAAASREVYESRALEVTELLDERRRRLTAYAVRHRTVVTPVEGRFVVAGRITDSATGVGLPDVRVQAWDLDRRQDDFLGETRTDALGYYRVEFGAEDFNDPDGIPETYIRVLAEDGTELHRSMRSFIDKAGEAAHISAAIAGSRVPESLARGTAVTASVERQVETLTLRQQVAPPVVALPEAPLRTVAAVQAGAAPAAPDTLARVTRDLRALAEVDRGTRVEARAFGDGSVRVLDELVYPVGGGGTPPLRPAAVPSPTTVPAPAPAAVREPSGALAPAPVPELTEVRGIGPARAAVLREAGITDLDHLAALDARRLSQVLGTTENVAGGILDSAREVQLRRG